ncbi:MAG TPA: hypothetical protein VMW56_03965 [Candidatus Margulisiibacteriota bacterium]|nr:hypothetical protein [Candidatus Margulisiibacteriota bacterium]
MNAIEATGERSSVLSLVMATAHRPARGSSARRSAGRYMMTLFSVVFTVLGLFATARVDGIELTKYSIETVEIPTPAGFRKYHPKTEAHFTDNFLRFDQLLSAIHLGRSAAVRWRDKGDLERLGYKKGSETVRWLDPGHLLWITWTTEPEGNFSYTYSGYVLLQVDGAQVQELFRDSIQSYASEHVWGNSNFELDATYSASSEVLTLIQTGQVRWTSEKRSLLDRPTPGNDEPEHGGEQTTKTVWHYRLAERRLAFISGEQSVEFPYELSAKAIASGLKVSLNDLVRLNPDLKRQTIVKVPLRTNDKIGAYKPEKSDGICDPACP